MRSPWMRFTFSLTLAGSISKRLSYTTQFITIRLLPSLYRHALLFLRLTHAYRPMDSSSPHVLLLVSPSTTVLVEHFA